MTASASVLHGLVARTDLILVDGNPLVKLDGVADAEKNFVLITKDGQIYKKTLGQ